MLRCGAGRVHSPRRGSRRGRLDGPLGWRHRRAAAHLRATRSRRGPCPCLAVPRARAREPPPSAAGCGRGGRLVLGTGDLRRVERGQKSSDRTVTRHDPSTDENALQPGAAGEPRRPAGERPIVDRRVLQIRVRLEKARGAAPSARKQRGETTLVVRDPLGASAVLAEPALLLRFATRKAGDVNCFPGSEKRRGNA